MKKKTFKAVATLGLFIAVSAILVSAQAATEKKAEPAKADDAAQSSAQAPAAGAPPAALAKKKTTDVSFEDVLVQGKYHFSDEAVTTVEQDKVLDALLGVRTDFKDRLKKSAARH